MAKGKDVLKQMVKLAERSKLSDATINAILNGVVINQTHEYRDGRLVSLANGQVTTLSPDRIVSVASKPAPSVPAPKKVHLKSDVSIKPKVTPSSEE